jgi:hypothetical protein
MMKVRKGHLGHNLWGPNTHGSACRVRILGLKWPTKNQDILCALVTDFIKVIKCKHGLVMCSDLTHLFRFVII